MPPEGTEPPRLRDLQASFLAALRAGAAAPPADFSAPPAAPVAARWSVYCEGYLLRLTEALRNDYPAVKRIVGAAAFRSLAARYFAAFPPHSHDITRAGDRLADYLAGDELAAGLPFLPDLARFEAALAAGVVAADLPPQRREDLAAHDPQLLIGLEITLAPGAAFFDSPWPLGELWELRDKPDSEVALRVEGRPSRLAVYRDGPAVRWRAVSDEEARLLAAAAAGATTLEALCAKPVFGPPEERFGLVSRLLVQLLEEGPLRIALPPQQVDLPETPACASTT